MASVIYDSFLNDIASGAIDVDTDTFEVMLSTSGFVPNRGTMNRRDDVTNEVSGTGYTAGGNVATLSLSLDTTNHRLDITLGGTTWPSSTITGAQVATYYKSRGGAASADELVASIDNGSGVSTSGTTLTLTASTLRFQN